MRETVPVSSSTLLHLLPLSTYRTDPDAPIRSPSLEREGFVHLSPDANTTLAVANTLYRNSEEPMVAVELDAASLSAPVRWEPPAPGPPEGVSATTLFPHLHGPIERSAVIAVYYARRDVEGRYLGLEQRGHTADELDLLPHPEGGWYRRTWQSGVAVARSDTRDTRPSATAIYFLLPAGHGSAWHTVASDELWLWHRGGPVTLTYGGDGAHPHERPRPVIVGPDLAAGQVPQAVVPAGTWQAATSESDSEALVSCVVSPGFDFADFRTL